MRRPINVNALFDSVTTIDSIIAGNVTIGMDPKIAVQANVTFLESSLEKPEVLSEITVEQRNLLRAGLDRGKAYL